MTDKRVVTPAKLPEDPDSNIRPSRLKDIIGQDRIIESLKIA